MAKRKQYRRNPARRVYKVSLIQHPEITDAEMAEYIKDAVGAWKGQFHPDDLLFQLDRDSVEVTSFSLKYGIQKEQDDASHNESEEGREGSREV